MTFNKTRKALFLLLLSLGSPTLIICQNTGIGTITPSEKLEVAGNIKADTLKSNELQLSTNPGAGKILTSDDVGNASWQEINIPIAPPLDLDHADGNAGFGLWGDCSSFPNIAGYHPEGSQEPATSDLFGNSVSNSGNYAIVGAPDDDLTFSNQGSASIYVFNGNTWNYLQQIVDPEGEADDNFGIIVFISGNYAIVGSSRDDVAGVTNQGSASVFQFDGTSWVFLEKIVDPEGQAFDHFGTSVTLSGDYAVIGAPYDDQPYNDQGSASIFHFNGTNWEFVQKLIDPTVGPSNDYFSIVAMSGEFIMVGSPQDHLNYSYQGAVSIFKFNGLDWQHVTKIWNAPSDHANFGYSIAMDGNFAVIGAPKYGTNYAGKVSVYWYNGTAWELNAEIYPTSPDLEEFFGKSVSIADKYILIGADRDVTYNGIVGSSSLFFRVANKWTRLQFIIDPYGAVYDFFGTSVSINHKGRFLIGASGFSTSRGKVVFGKAK